MVLPTTEGESMGKSSDKPVWMHRSDEPELTKLKNLLGLRNGDRTTTPDALSEAIRLAVKKLEQEA